MEQNEESTKEQQSSLLDSAVQQNEEEHTFGGGSFIRPRTFSTLSDLNLNQEVKQISFHDYLSRFMYSKMYWIIFLILILISIFLLIWTFVKRGRPKEIWFIFLEGVITFTLCAEIILRILLERRMYLKSCLNWVDFVITFMCLVSFVLFILSAQGSFEKELGGILETCLILFRYITQILRIISLIRHQNASRLLKHDFDIEMDIPLNLESTHEEELQDVQIEKVEDDIVNNTKEEVKEEEKEEKVEKEKV